MFYGNFDVFKCFGLKKKKKVFHLTEFTTSGPGVISRVSRSHAPTLFNKRTGLDSHTWTNTSRHMSVHTKHQNTWSRRTRGALDPATTRDVTASQRPRWPPHSRHFPLADCQIGLRHTDWAPECITRLHEDANAAGDWRQHQVSQRFHRAPRFLCCGTRFHTQSTTASNPLKEVEWL